MVRRRSHRRAISRHRRVRKTKRRQDLRSRRWRHPKTGDRFANMQARDEYGRTHKWLVSLGVKENWKISPTRKFTIGKKVDELTTLLGQMSMKKKGHRLSKLFNRMSIKKRSRKKSR